MRQTVLSRLAAAVLAAPVLAAAVLAVAILATSLASAPAARADDRADDSAMIRTVIEEQIAAFAANDLDAAFGFASPSIQRMFRDPGRFGQMVERGYPMVWRPARFEMLEIVQTERGPVQLVLFEDQAGRLHEAGYLMTEVGGVWRIDGVHVRKTPGLGT